MEYDPLPDRPSRPPEKDPTSPLVALRRRAGEKGRSAWSGARRHPWLRRLIPAVIALVAGAVLGVVVGAAIHIPRVDELDGFSPSMITQVLDSEGQVFAQFAREKRILLKEDEVPLVLQNAIVALEDSKFFQHGGIDAMGAVRAALSNMKSGGRGEGASTITMQLARALFYSPEKKWKRKIAEAFTAVELEKRFSKQQILTLYCNLINLGHGNYGMAQAAHYYYDKTVDQLEVHEAAMLAGIPQRPSDYSPYRRPERVRARRDWVLKRMLAEGYLSEADYQAAIEKPLGVVPQRRDLPFAPYFAEEIRQAVEHTYGTKALLEGGLQVQSTLDSRIQRAAEAGLRANLLRLDHRKGWRGALRQVEGDPATATLDSWGSAALIEGRWYQGLVLGVTREGATVRLGEQALPLAEDGVRWTRRRPDQVLKVGDVAWFRPERTKDEPEEKGEKGEEPSFHLYLEQEPQLEGAVVVLESATGAVRALVGGWDFERSKFDRAVQAKRQVGSAFKTFVWGAAVEAGYSAADTLFDAPTYFAGAENRAEYRPRNFSRGYYGIVTLRRALEKSINMTAVKLMDMVGVERTIDFARRCGIDSNLPPYPSLALGVAEVTPLRLAGAYAAMANQGTYVAPHLMERVLSPTGQVLEETVPETRYVTSPEAAFVLTSMLKGVIERGTGQAVNDLPIDLAGKTGTTDDFSDAWFVGFTPRYTILTWVGYDLRRPIGHNMTGAEAALPPWRSIVEAGLRDGWLQEGEKFVPPPGIHMMAVERFTGLLPTPAAEQIIVEAFVPGTEPAQSYDPHWRRVMELPWYQQRPFYLPKENERMPEDFEDVARLEDQKAIDRD